MYVCIYIHTYIWLEHSLAVSNASATTALTSCTRTTSRSQPLFPINVAGGGWRASCCGCDVKGGRAGASRPICLARGVSC